MLTRTLLPDTSTALVRLIELPADRHPAAVYLSRLAPGSRRTMRQALDVIAGILAGQDARSLDWPAVGYQHARAVRTVLAERYKAATANKMLSALRGVLKETWRLGYTTAEDYHRAADLEAVRGETLPAGRALGAGEIAALFGACSADSSPAGSRDAALLALLYGAGLRRSEAVALDVGDYEKETGALTVRHGKGNKARICYVTNGAAEAFGDWLDARGDHPGPLFVSINRGGRLGSQRITDQAVMVILTKRAGQAGIAHVSPHDLRRTFVGDLLDRGADISTVQKLAGHANVTTTQRYDRRGEQTKRQAAELLHVPYVGRA